MYNYDFKLNDEEILKEEANVQIKFDNNYFMSQIILTNKNIIFFVDTEQDNILKGRMVQITLQYEVLFKFKSNFKDYKVSDENTYLTINESQIILYNFDLQKFTNK